MALVSVKFSQKQTMIYKTNSKRNTGPPLYFSAFAVRGKHSPLTFTVLRSKSMAICEPKNSIQKPGTPSVSGISIAELG